MLRINKSHVSVQVAIESVKVVSIALVSAVNSGIGIRPRSIKFELKIEMNIVIGLGHYVAGVCGVFVKTLHVKNLRLIETQEMSSQLQSGLGLGKLFRNNLRIIGAMFLLRII